MTYHNTPLSWSKSIIIIHISKVEMDTDNSLNQTQNIFFISLSLFYFVLQQNSQYLLYFILYDFCFIHPHLNTQ